MAILSVQTPISDGSSAFTMASAAGGGDSFQNTGVEFFKVTNGGVGSITVTFDSPGTCSFGLAANAAHDLAVTVAAGATKVIGPFPVAKFNDANGRVQVTYSGVTSVTVAVQKAA